MTKKQFQEYLGIAPVVIKSKGNPFQTFKNKQEANDYLIARGIISKEELAKRVEKSKFNEKQLAYLADNQIPY